MVFMVNIPLGIIMLLLSYRSLRETVKKVETGMDWLGSVLLASALTLILTALTFGPQREWTYIDFVVERFWIPIVNIWVERLLYLIIPLIPILAAGILLLAVFFTVELKLAKIPVLDLRLLRSNRAFFSTNLEALFIYTAHFSTTFILAFYLGLVIGMGPFEVGLVLSSFPLSVLIASPFGGWLADRYGSKEASLFGAGAVTLSLILLSNLPSASLWYLVSTLVMMGVGMGIFAPANTSRCLSSVSFRQRSTANGILGMMRYVGQTMSLAVSTAIVGLFLPANLYLGGGVIVIREYLKGISQALIIEAFICGLAIFTALAVKESKADGSPNPDHLG